MEELCSLYQKHILVLGRINKVIIQMLGEDVCL